MRAPRSRPDIIFLRKREEGGENVDAAPWVDTVEVELPARDGGMATGRVNEYFVAHPEQVLGEPGMWDMLTAGPRYAVRERPGANLQRDLKAAMARMVENAPAPESAAADRGDTAVPEAEVIDVAMKEDSFYVNDAGELMQYRQGGRAPARRAPDRPGRRVALTKKAQRTVMALLPVRDAYRDVLAKDMADDTDAQDEARLHLNQVYDTFAAKFGPIRKTITTYRKRGPAEIENLRREAREAARSQGLPWEEGSFDDADLIFREGEGVKPASAAEVAKTRQAARDVFAFGGREFDEGTFQPSEVPAAPVEKYPNWGPFMSDPEAYRLAALENLYNEETGEASKAAVFRENVLRRDAKPSIESAQDAMIHVLASTGRFDLAMAAVSWGKSEQETIEALGDLVYDDPAQDDWVMSEEYLSGNVVQKLAEAKAKGPRYERNVTALEGVQPKYIMSEAHPHQARQRLGGARGVREVRHRGPAAQSSAGNAQRRPVEVGRRVSGPEPEPCQQRRLCRQARERRAYAQ